MQSFAVQKAMAMHAAEQRLQHEERETRERPPDSVNYMLDRYSGEQLMNFTPYATMLEAKTVY